MPIDKLGGDAFNNFSQYESWFSNSYNTENWLLNFLEITENW